MGIYIPLRHSALGIWLERCGRRVTREEFNGHTPGDDGLYGVAHVWSAATLNVACVADTEAERARIGRESSRNPDWHLVDLEHIRTLLPDFPPMQFTGPGGAMMTTSDDMKRLAAGITAFLDEYAQVRPDYDPEFDDPEDRWTGPDSSLLAAAADDLAKGEIPRPFHCSWESGCFAPYGSIEGREELGRLKETLLVVIAAASAPTPR